MYLTAKLIVLRLVVRKLDSAENIHLASLYATPVDKHDQKKLVPLLVLDEIVMDSESLRSERSETVDDKESLTQSQEQIMTGDGIVLQIQRPQTSREPVRKWHGWTLINGRLIKAPFTRYNLLSNRLYNAV